MTTEVVTNAAAQTVGETGQSANATATGGQSDAQQAEAKFTQADIDRIVKGRLAEEKSRAESKAKQDADAAEAKRLTEQGEFKTLAEKAQAEALVVKAQAETLAAKAERQGAVLKQMYEARVKTLSAEAKAALDSLPESMDEVERLAFLDKNAALFAGTTKPVANGTPAPRAGVKPAQQAAGQPETKQANNKPMARL